MKKAIFFLPLLLLIAYPAYALTTINAQSSTSCDVTGYCETKVDLGKFLTSPAISIVKATNYSQTIDTIENETSLKNMGYKFVNNSIVVYGKTIENTYWSLDLKNGYAIDPWWNVSWANCKNISIEIYQTEVDTPLTVNLTELRLTNSYEGRLINNSCNETGTAINYTVLDYKTTTDDDDWANIEFPFSGSSNVTWAYYYNNPTAADPAYLYVLFHPNMTSMDFTNDWVSGDQAKYTMINGIMNASRVDAGQYDTDQLQTKSDFSSYTNITFYDVVLDANTNPHYDRYFAGTNASGVWLNNYNLLSTAGNKWRLYYLNPAVQDIDSNIAVSSKNFSVKVWYTSSADDAMLWIFNTSSGTNYWSRNVTDVAYDIKYWGTWTDSTFANVPVQYYRFKIYLGYVNPRENNLPKITVGSEESSPAAPPAPTVKDNTVICFKTQPVCINLKDSTLIYKGEGYYA